MYDVRAGVVGAGVFGGHHAAKYAALDGARLVGVHDLDAGRAQALAAKHETRAFDSFDALLAEVDVVTVAASAQAHFELAARALEAGRHVLVEKPIALSLDQADALVRRAQARDLVLQVGHQERYVFEAIGALRRDTGPRAVHCRRCGPFTGRGDDVSVVFDLMIHDLDLMRRVLRGGLSAVEVEARAERTPFADAARAQLDFSDGAFATLEASRVDEARARDMRLVYDDGEIVIDFVARRVTNTTGQRLAYGFDDADAPLELRDPLGFGVKSFLDCVRSGARPLVSGEDGRDALAWALRIEAAIAPESLRAAG